MRRAGKAREPGRRTLEVRADDTHPDAVARHGAAHDAAVACPAPGSGGCVEAMAPMARKRALLTRSRRL